MNNNSIKLALAVGIAGSILGLSNPAAASGFQLIEQSVSGMGNAYAGVAASAEDATTVFFNPAGMTRLKDSQAIGALHYIVPSSEFKDKGSFQALPVPPFSIDLQGGDGGDGGVSAVVANFYYVQGLNEDWTFGLGINTPFGLETDWSNTWQGRYHGVTSEVLTVNINPALAYKVDDKLSLGGGIDLQYVDATLSNAIDITTICNGLLIVPCAGLPQTGDALGEVTGDDWGFGFNLGLLYEISATTRVGAAYRSKIGNTLEGKAKFKDISGTGNLATIQAGGLFLNSDVEADIDLPATLSVSGYHELDAKWAVMADISWTEWSKLDELVIEYDVGAQGDTTEVFDWDDTFRYGVGVNYRHSDTLLWRGGIAFDESPVPSKEKRGVRIPDNDRLWLAFGAGFKPARGITVDVGYAHLFVDESKINNTNITGHTLVGEFDNSVDILSAQVVWAF